MSSRGKTDSRRVPAAAWWGLITLAYMWGYQEGRQIGQIEGYARAIKAWVPVFKAAIR